MDKNQWHVGKPGFVFIYGPQGEEIAQVSPFQFTDADARALAAQIVREHNAHDELVAALSEVDEHCQAGLNSSDPAHWEAALQDIMNAARGVLAKAGAL